MASLTTAPGGAVRATDEQTIQVAHRMISVALLALLPVLAITVDVLAGGPLRHLDDAVAGATWHRADPVLVHLGFVLDRLGQRAVAGAVLVLVAAVLAWRRRSWRPLVVTGVGLLALNLVVGALKLGIGRTKPLAGVDLLHAGGSQFPSGHAANAVLCWGLLSYLLLVHGRPLGEAAQRWLVAAPVLLTLAVCGASLYLDFHWLTDLVAGAALGLTLLMLVGAWDLRRADPGPTRATPGRPAATAPGRALVRSRPPF